MKRKAEIVAKAVQLVSALLETDLDWEPDPEDPDDQVKPLINELPSKLDSAIDDALAQFNRLVDRRHIWEPVEADDLAMEVCWEIAEKHGFENGSEGFESIFSVVHSRASELFPGEYGDDYDG